jgi:hypothetical protein
MHFVTESISQYIDFCDSKSRVRLNTIIPSRYIGFTEYMQIPAITDFYIYFDTKSQLRFEYKSSHSENTTLNIVEINRILGCDYNYYINITQTPNTDDIQFDIVFFDNVKHNTIAKMYFTVSYSDLSILKTFITMDEFITYNEKDSCLDIEFLSDISKKNYKNTLEKYPNYKEIICAKLWFHMFEYCCDYFAHVLIQKNN